MKRQFGRSQETNLDNIYALIGSINGLQSLYLSNPLVDYENIDDIATYLLCKLPNLQILTLDNSHA